MASSNDKVTTIAVVGLGYVGLPLALAFGRTSVPTIGFDINKKRVADLKKGIDTTDEISTDEIKSSKLIYSTDEKDLSRAQFIIVAVPTPVTPANQPDLKLVELATELVARNMKKGTIVVYESTVYPGVTEDICVPILEKVSGLKWHADFTVGYSPERINPGDKEHTLERIVKVVSGEDERTSEIVAQTYSLVCQAGVFRAKNIKTAEAAKVIENTQRDLNIALINELSLIFHRIGIDTQDVLEAAGTKWNFLKFTPGLVGGHCIGVDPYYLVHKAKELGYHPEVIAAGRKVNDYMPEFVAEETVKGLIEAKRNLQECRVLVMGLTFKENIRDMRNSKITVTIAKLKELGIEVIGFDPFLSKQEIATEFNLTSISKLHGKYDGVIIATPHALFKEYESVIPTLLKKSGVVMDIKRVFPGLQNKPGIDYKSL